MTTSRTLLLSVIMGASILSQTHGAPPEESATSVKRKPMVLICEARPSSALLTAWDAGLGRPDDIVSSAPLTDNRDIVAKVKMGQHAWMSPSAAAVMKGANQAGSDIRWIFYNLEGWNDTPAEERKDPVAAVRKLREVCRSHGWKLALVPDNRFGNNLKLATEVAPYLDAYIIQCQKYQNPKQVEQLRVLAREIRRVNAACKVGAQLGVGVPEKYGPDERALWFYRETCGFLDIYETWWGTQESMITLLKMLDANATKGEASQPKHTKP